MYDNLTEGTVPHRLISSRMVEGTAVYDPAGKKIGKIHSMMIDKASGQVAYAVLAFGGFLRVDEQVHPIPWEKLRYDSALGGYVSEITQEILDAAPSLTLDLADRPYAASDEERMYRHYNLWPMPML